MDSQHTQPPIPPTKNFLDMNELIGHLFQEIADLKQDVRNCHEKHIEAEQFRSGALVKALERNTSALEKIEKHLAQLKIKRIK